MATHQVIDRFKSAYLKWYNNNYLQIYRVNLGEVSLKSLEKIFNEINLRLEKTDENLELLPNTVITTIIKTLNNFSDYLNQVTNYSDSLFVEKRNEIIDQILNYNEELLSIWSQIIALINDSDNKKYISNLLSELNRVKEKSIQDQKEIDKIKSDLTNDLKEFEERYKNEIFNKAEILKQEDSFNEDAKICIKNAHIWLFMTALSAICLLVYITFFLNSSCLKMECYENISKIEYEKTCQDCHKILTYVEVFRHIAYKLLIISVLSFLVNISLKNYNASMHNFTVNKHKANSLSSALVLLEKAKTEIGNDQLMSQVASAIFSHQPTSYSSKDPENIITASLIEKITDKI